MSFVCVCVGGSSGLPNIFVLDVSSFLYPNNAKSDFFFLYEENKNTLATFNNTNESEEVGRGTIT